jgi:hypothetical protein
VLSAPQLACLLSRRRAQGGAIKGSRQACSQFGFGHTGKVEPEKEHHILNCSRVEVARKRGADVSYSYVGVSVWQRNAAQRQSFGTKTFGRSWSCPMPPVDCTATTKHLRHQNFPPRGTPACDHFARYSFVSFLVFIATSLLCSSQIIAIHRPSSSSTKILDSYRHVKLLSAGISK